MFPSRYKPLDLIGLRLRESWAEVVTAPLPEELRCLVEALSRAQKTKQHDRVTPVDSLSSAAGPSRE
jgi:hypothetical protein